MFKKFSFWLWVTVIFQFLTGAFHSISLFVTPKPKNDAEKQLFDLVNNYHIPDGMGFNPTMGSLFLALSSCFSLVCFFGGLLNIYLYKNKIPQHIMNGVMGINAVIFGICFGMMAAFTFLPPVIFTGLIFIGSTGAFLTSKTKPSDI